MTTLSVYQCDHPQLPNKTLNHTVDIVSTLHSAGIVYQQLSLPARLRPGCDEAQLSEVSSWLEAFAAEQQLRVITWLKADRQHPLGDTLGATYREEQRLQGRSLWLVLGGYLQLNVHQDDQVFQLRLEAGDCVEVSAAQPHWLDLGQEPHVLAVQLRGDEKAAEPTHSHLAAQFPGLDD